MVKKNGNWGSVRILLFRSKQIYYSKNFKYNILYKVCNSGFAQMEAQSACNSLGYTGGMFETIDQQNWSKNEIPILMDNVRCISSKRSFLDCAHWTPQTAEQTTTNRHLNRCGHHENVLLHCGPKQVSDKGLKFNLFQHRGSNKKTYKIS